MASSAKTFARGAMHVSKRLVASYVLDWVFILGIAGVGAGFNRITYSNKRSFVLQDPSIAYPNDPDTVSPGVLIIIALVAPGIITFIVSLLFVPGGGAPRGTPAALKWRRKLWEWNTAWMGLALALASAFMVTEGLKDLAGKPRPHMLAVCKPNLDLISQYQVGGLSTTLGPAIPIMVDFGICTETDPKTLRDAFASWPSGHSSFSFAGLLYLSFFLSAKFAVTIPFLNPMSWRKGQKRIPTFSNGLRNVSETVGINGHESGGMNSNGFPNRGSQNMQLGSPASEYAPRNQAAAPPVYLLVVVFVPVAVAIFVCVSRWFDYHHHGFDIISGALLGIFTSWFSFRFYHMPIQRSAGWSWGARTRDRAFWLGVGREGYVGDEGWEAKKFDTHTGSDLEMGKMSGGLSSESAGLEQTPLKSDGHNATVGNAI